jgi:DNA repair protein RadA/Sms
VVGWDSNRLAMLLAVLEARCGVAIGTGDVYLNVAGGLRISEPAADLAAAAALLSALSNEPVADKTVIFGEIGLSGEVRPVGQSEARLREAAKLGFLNAYAPPRHGGEAILRVAEVRHVRQLVERFMEQTEGHGTVLPVRRRAR